STAVMYTLSLHDALPIFCGGILLIPIGIIKIPRIHFWLTQNKKLMRLFLFAFAGGMGGFSHFFLAQAFGFSSFEYAELSEAYEKDRKSTRLNSSHVSISY